MSIDQAKNENGTSKDKKKTVLFVAMDAIGHINSLKCIANSLKKQGHRTVFLFHDPIDSGLRAAGHEVYDCSHDQLIESEPSPQTEQKWQFMMDRMSKMWREPNFENLRQGCYDGWGAMMEMTKAKDEIFGRKLALIKPDVFILDHFFMHPALIKYNKPWALVWSASPLSLHPSENNLPLPFFGFPTNFKEAGYIPDERQYSLEFEDKIRKDKLELLDRWNKYLVEEHGLKPCPSDPIFHFYPSDKLNVYMYPEELNYAKPVPGWVQCDSMLRINSDQFQQSNQTAEFKLPEKLADKPGKLIFLSMGTLFSGDVQLMKHFVSILAKAPHKFIVSMGLNWDKYELADNMWGEKYVDQLALLPHIDMIITHGGNNTLTECFYYGVPGFIVCPAFGDQRDNARRIEDCKFGKWIDPIACDEANLLAAIDQILSDQSIRPRMKAISERMQLPENKFKVIRLFADFVDQA